MSKQFTITLEGDFGKMENLVGRNAGYDGWNVECDSNEELSIRLESILRLHPMSVLRTNIEKCSAGTCIVSRHILVRLP